VPPVLPSFFSLLRCCCFLLTAPYHLLPPSDAPLTSKPRLFGVSLSFPLCRDASPPNAIMTSDNGLFPRSLHMYKTPLSSPVFSNTLGPDLYTPPPSLFRPTSSLLIFPPRVFSPPRRWSLGSPFWCFLLGVGSPGTGIWALIFCMSFPEGKFCLFFLCFQSTYKVAVT